MSISVSIANKSQRKRFFRADELERLADKICRHEGITARAEISLYFCDDEEIAALNKSYRRAKGPTDVLTFGQFSGAETGKSLAPSVLKRINRSTNLVSLGDIIISLETVERAFEGARTNDRRKHIKLLVCHGLLHLLGYVHASAADRAVMTDKQALYLVIPREEAWIDHSTSGSPKRGHAKEASI